MSATPGTKAPTYTALAGVVTRCRDFFAGTDAVHARGVTYLPRFSGESDPDYQRRSTQTEVFNATKRTIRALNGFLHRVPVALADDVPAPLVAQWEDVDGAGTHGTVFASDLTLDGLVSGIAGVLVDYANIPEGASVSLADEQAAGLRPYVVRYEREQVWQARMGRVGTRWGLTYLELAESHAVPDGPYGETEVQRLRVFRHTEAGKDERGRATGGVTYELWEETTKADAAAGVTGGWKAVTPETPVRGAGGAPLSGIPFILFAFGERAPARLGAVTVAGPLAVLPPLLDLVDLNLGHYRVSADRRNVITLACTPTLTVFGLEEPAGGWKIGPSACIGGMNQEAKAAWLEVSGTAFEPTAAEIQRLEQQMAACGLAFLATDTRAAETAEAKRLDASAQNASLTVTAWTLRDGLERCLGFMAEYQGLVLPKRSSTEGGGSVVVNTDFEARGLDPATLTALNATATAGNLSLETFWGILESRGVLPDDFDAEDERQRLADHAAEGQAQAVALMRETARVEAAAGGDDVEDEDEAGDDEQRRAA